MATVKKLGTGRTARWALKDGRKTISTHRLRRYAFNAKRRYEGSPPKKKKAKKRTKTIRATRRVSRGGAYTSPEGKARDLRSRGQSHAVQILDKKGKRLGSVHPYFTKVKEEYTTKKGKTKTRMVQVKHWRARDKKGKLLGKPTKLQRIAKARVLRTKKARGYRNED